MGDSSGVLGGAASGAASGASLGPWGAVAGAVIGAAGSWLSGRSSASAAESQYKQRYQWQVKDLKKAGLNPMLAVSQGAPNVPQPQFPDIGEGALKGAAVGVQAQLAKAQAANIQADTLLKGSATALNVASARESSIRSGIAEASLPWAPHLAQSTAMGADKAIAVQNMQVEKLGQEVAALKLDNAQKERIMPLLVEAQKLINQGLDADLVKKDVWAGLYEIAPDRETVNGILEILSEPGQWPKKISEWGKKHGYETRTYTPPR